MNNITLCILEFLVDILRNAVRSFPAILVGTATYYLIDEKLDWNRYEQLAGMVVAGYPVLVLCDILHELEKRK